ncbi:hypothetical protein BT69DRAFT_1279395 [Atractiella rhizophila]|nr:hypothetical protein BT69DRAFT_1279395 [Atractiella rhizophila]
MSAAVTVQGEPDQCASVKIEREGAADGEVWTAVVRQGALVLENVLCTGPSCNWTIDIKGRTALSVCYEPAQAPTECSFPLTVVPNSNNGCLGKNVGFITQASSGKKSNVGAIVGGVLGGVVLLSLLTSLLYLYLRRRRRASLSSSSPKKAYAFTNRPESQVEGGQLSRLRKGSTQSHISNASSQTAVTTKTNKSSSSRWTPFGKSSERDAVEFPFPPPMKSPNDGADGKSPTDEFPPIPPVVKVPQSFVIENPEEVARRGTK